MNMITAAWMMIGAAGFAIMDIRVFEFVQMNRHVFGSAAVARIAGFILCLLFGPLTMVRVVLDCRHGRWVT